MSKFFILTIRNYRVIVLFFLLFSQNLLFSHQVNKTTKQEINIGIRNDFTSIDPIYLDSLSAQRLGNDLYEGLMTESKTGEIVPGIAESYELSENGKVYTFKIRENAKFSDGSDIKANDVLFSFQRLVDPQNHSYQAFLFESVLNASKVRSGKLPVSKLGIKILDDRMIEIILKNPNPYFLNILSLPQLSIIKEQNTSTEKFPYKMVSSGAFVLTKWADNQIVLQKNRLYWDSKSTLIETVYFHLFNDSNSEIQMYRAGLVDFTFDVPSSKIDSLRELLGSEAVILQSLATHYLEFNLNTPPFRKNIKLRQALSMAIDRDFLTREILNRSELPAYDLIPPGINHYENQNYAWAYLPHEKRLSEAQTLFKESGFSKENPLIFELAYSSNKTDSAVISAIVNMWKEAFDSDAIKPIIRGYDFKDFIKFRGFGKFSLSSKHWRAKFNDAGCFLELLISKSLYNSSGFENHEYDKLHNESLFENNIEKRQKIIEEAINLALQEYPIIPLFFYSKAHLIKPHVRGVNRKKLTDHFYTKMMFIQKDEIRDKIF